MCVHIHSRLHIQRIHTPLSMFVGCRLPVVQIQAVLRSRTDKKMQQVQGTLSWSCICKTLTFDFGVERAVYSVEKLKKNVFTQRK